MGKYGSGLTINDVCKLEVEEAKGILSSYGVSKEDTKTITDMIVEAYFQLTRSNTSNRALESLMVKKGAEYTLNEYMKCFAEEEQKFPFEIDDEEAEDIGDEGENEDVSTDNAYDNIHFLNHDYAEEDEMDYCIDPNMDDYKNMISEIIASAKDIEDYSHSLAIAMKKKLEALEAKSK